MPCFTKEAIKEKVKKGNIHGQKQSKQSGNKRLIGYGSNGRHRCTQSENYSTDIKQISICPFNVGWHLSWYEVVFDRLVLQ